MSDNFFTQTVPPKGNMSADIVSGFGLPAYDNVVRTLTNATTETYVFSKAGKTVATIVVVYTDSTLATLASATKS